MEDNSGTDRDKPNIVLDDLTRKVAQLLPFPVELQADMSYTGALFIDLGRRGDTNDPADTASIDGDVRPVVWVLDVEGGRETLMSGFGPAADPAEVADWISAEARRVGSPAAEFASPPEGSVVISKARKYFDSSPQSKGARVSGEVTDLKNSSVESEPT